MTLATETISYADLTTRGGITRECDGRTLRIVIPPLRRLRDLPWGYKLGVPYLMLCMMAATIGPVLVRPVAVGAVLGNSTIYFITLAVVLWGALRRMRVSTMLVISLDEFMVITLVGQRRIRARNWPRGLVQTIKRNLNNGKLQILVIGRAIIEIPVNADYQATDWIATELMSALQSLPVEPMNTLPAETI